MKRRDVWVVGGVLLLGLALLIAGRFLRPAPASGSGRDVLKAVLVSDDPAAPGEADSYLRIKQGRAYYELIPLDREAEITITQEGGWENVIHIGRDSVVMHSANCPNRDCVRQGRMTLDNIGTRVFQQWITCLPHQLSLELLTKQQALGLIGGPGE